MFKERVQLYSAGKGRWAPGEDIQHIFPKGGGTQGKKLSRWVFGGAPLTFIWNTLITYLIHIHSWPIASCSNILQELTNSLTLLCRLSCNPSWVALISELQLPIQTVNYDFRQVLRRKVIDRATVTHQEPP